MDTQDVKYQFKEKMTTTELQLSRNGQKCVTGDVTFTASDKVAYIVVNADATFSNLTDQSDNDILTESAIGGVTLSTGMIISAKNGGMIKRVNVSSGSVLAIFG
jgi:hypothetical protein